MNYGVALLATSYLRQIYEYRYAINSGCVRIHIH